MDRQAAWIRRGVLGAALLLAAPNLGDAQTFSSGSTGTDGAFSPTVDTTITLPPNGVFNFTTINIPAGVTVTFQKNPANTPVTMLATGDVVIAGTILLDGQPGGDAVAGVLIASNAGEGGPGGFDGGPRGNGLITKTGGKGLGPGGGNEGVIAPINFKCSGGGGGYGTRGGDLVCTSGVLIFGGPTYGSPALLPLIGGSGGGGGAGDFNRTGGGGGGGGGAIVIASSTRIVLTGSIFARGGRGGGTGGIGLGAGGGGSGGAVRLVANSLEGSGGSINVAGGFGLGQTVGAGGNGRIRLEAFESTLAATFSVTPSLAKPNSVFLTNPPALQIASVGGVTPPATPTGSFATPDVTLPATTTNPVTVSITASQIPLGTPVTITVIPFNGSPSVATSPGLSGTTASSTTSANVTIPTDQPVVLSATATFTVLASAGHPPIMVGGEPVKWVKVAATYGGSSKVTYITASGKEVPAESVTSGDRNP